MNRLPVCATLGIVLLAALGIAGCLGATDEPVFRPGASPPPPRVQTGQTEGVAGGTTAGGGGSSSTASTRAKADPCAASETEDPGEPDPSIVYDELHFEWEYKGEVWEWNPAILHEWWDYYANRAHPDDSSDYGILATDPYDDAIITQIVCMIRDAARDAGYTPGETVQFTLSFVQSLRYVTDKVGTGFDEWPKFPIETLVDEGGDCEDTSILLATLLREMGYDAVLLHFDHVNNKPNIGHVAVGVYSQSIPGGTYWTSSGRNYYYVETTDSGWKIGELPDMVRGQKAQVLHLTPQAILTDLTFTSPTYENGLYVFSVSVHNMGSAPARNLVVVGGWGAGSNRLWSAQTWNEGYDLGPDEEVTITFWIKPPPQNVQTRAEFMAWGANAASVSALSGFFAT